MDHRYLVFFISFITLVTFGFVDAQLTVDEVSKEITTSVALAPAIVISHPANEERFKEDTISVSGSVRASDTISKLVITADNRLGLSDYKVVGVAKWESQVLLAPGANNIIVRAYDLKGDIAGRSIVKVYYIPPELAEKIADKRIPELLEREELAKRFVISRLREISRMEADRYLIDNKTADLRRTAFEIKVIDSIGDMDVLIEEYNDVITALNTQDKTTLGLSASEELLETFVRVESDLTDIDWAIIKIEFSDEELNLRRLIREGLFMVWYDDDESSETFGRWVRLRKGSPEWVNDVGINKTGRYVWANVSHFSVYGIGGQVTGQTEPPQTTTTPPETSPPATETPAPPDTQPPTHFPKETPRPTVSTPSDTTSAPVTTKPSVSSGKVKPFRILLIIVVVVLLFASGYIVGRKKKRGRESVEKDLLPEEETPPR